MDEFENIELMPDLYEERTEFLVGHWIYLEESDNLETVKDYLTNWANYFKRRLLKEWQLGISEFYYNLVKEEIYKRDSDEQLKFLASIGIKLTFKKYKLNNKLFQSNE